MQELNPLDANKKAKYSLNLAILHFQNTVKNPSAKSTISLEIAITRLLLYFYANYLSLNII